MSTIKLENTYGVKTDPTKVIVGWLDTLNYIDKKVEHLNVLNAKDKFMVQDTRFTNGDGHGLTLLVSMYNGAIQAKWFNPTGKKGMKYYDDASTKAWNEQHKDLLSANVGFDTANNVLVRVRTSYDDQNVEAPSKTASFAI